MKLFFCGGSSEVGASCILVEIQERRILLDCGMRMKGDRMPDLNMIQQAGGVDAIILSHAHMDHSGVLPVVSTEFPDATIRCTPPTANLVQVLLGDSIKIIKLSQEEEIPLYDRKQVDATLDRIERHPFSTPFPVGDDDRVQVTLFPAGHILGAASVYISSKDGSLFYSGDISADRQRTIPQALVPRLTPSICIFESTYGNRLHSDRSAEESRFIEQISDVISKGGKVLIPAFAVGRAQEVILILRKAINTGVLPGCKVYVDGMVREVCRIYKSSPNYLSEQLAKNVWKGREPFFSENVIPVGSQDQRESIIKSDEPCCIVASSGMLSGGASAFYAEHLAKDEKSFISITGYQDEESPGSKLQDLFSSNQESEEERCITLNGRSVAVKCGLGTFGLSAHADKTQLCGFIKQLNPRRVFLVHGDKTAVTSLQSALVEQNFRGRVTVPNNGSSYMIDCKPGRNYRVREAPFSFRRVELPDKEGLELISERLRAVPDGEQLSWSATELSQMWGPGAIGKEEQFMELLNASPYFECDPRRLYLFKAVTPDEAELTNASLMEVNAMLALLKESFPPDVMYKCGARLKTHTARIFFRFPDVQGPEYAKRIEEFKRHSGWSVELNTNPDTSSFMPLLHELAGDEAVRITKTAWRTDNKTVTLDLSNSLTAEKRVAEEFHKRTGYTLLLPGADANRKDNNEQPRGKYEPKCTQHEAMLAIDDAFGPEDVTIYKKSVKTQGDSKFIELQFLTPEVGTRYISWLKGIHDQTGWPITVATNPRQQELIMLARSCAASSGVTITKGPSIRQSDQCVDICIAENAVDEMISQAMAEFEQKSGFQMRIL